VSLESTFAEFRDRAEFFVVYIREAHPTDGWELEGNVPLEDPKTLPQRGSAASACRDALGITIPVLVDDMDDTVNRAYTAWPERLFVVDVDGRVAYAGGPGPFQFKPAELHEFLAGRLGAR